MQPKPAAVPAPPKTLLPRIPEWLGTIEFPLEHIECGSLPKEECKHESPDVVGTPQALLIPNVGKLPARQFYTKRHMALQDVITNLEIRRLGEIAFFSASLF